MYLDYSEYIEQIKEALKIKRQLECYEEMDLKNILDAAARKGYEIGYEEGKGDSESDGWFSIDYPHGWMSGLLDVDGEYGRKNDVPPVDKWVAGKDYLGD